MPYLLLLAALKIAGALVLWGAAQARAPVAYPHPFPPWYHLLFLAAFAGTGAALLWAARTDRRARAFGVVLVSFGTIFADPLLRHALLTADGLQAGIGRLLYATQVVAFTPAALWLFASVFPAREPRRIGWLDPIGMATVAAGVGAAALIVNMADAIVGQRIPGPMLDWLRVSRDGSLWAVLSLLDLPAFVFLVLKGRRAAPRERRHAFRFLAGLAVGMLPLAIDVLLNTAVPAYVEATRAPARGQRDRDDRQRGAAAGTAADRLRGGRTAVRRAVHAPPRRAVRAGALHGDCGALDPDGGTGRGRSTSGATNGSATS